MKRILELDGIRTFAVFSVVACHYAPVPIMFHHLSAYYGGLGVDVFFVLSGFLITTILLDLKDPDLKHAKNPYRVFYARRTLRIIPPYALLLTIVYGIACLAHDPIELSKVGGQLLFLRSFPKFGTDIHHLVAVLRHPSLIPNPFSVSFHKPVPPDYPVLPITASLGPTWSLSVEEWFYLLWAPIILLLRRPAIVAVGIGALIMGMLVRWWLVDPVCYLTRSADVLIAGALLAIWMEHRETLGDRRRALCDLNLDVAALISAAIFILLAFVHRELLSMTFAEIAFAGMISWLVRHAGTHNPIARTLRFGPLVYLGSISYMLYLIHLPMYFLVRSGMSYVAVSLAATPRYWCVSAISLALSIAFSALSWRFYEAPILRHKDRFTEWAVGRSQKQPSTVDAPH